MTLPTGESTAQVLSPLLESDTVDFQDNISAHEYFSQLTKYLQNVTILSSRPRPSDLLLSDKFAGFIWLIIVPIIYFVTIGLILVLLLSFFWYLDGRGVVSAAQSEVTLASGTGNSVRHETLIVSDTDNQSTGHSVVLNYLMNTAEFHASIRTSKTNIGSTRSLGVFTEKNLQRQCDIASSVDKSKAFSSERIQLSTNNQECFGNRGTSDGALFKKLYKSRGSDRSEISSTSGLRMSDLDTETHRNSASFSTDSLQETNYIDTLRASMESQKQVWTASGEIGPEDLYGSGKATHESIKSTNLKVINKNYITDNRVECDNRVFADQAFVFLDTDEHLKKTYQAAVNMEKNENTMEAHQSVDSPIKTATNSTKNTRIPADQQHFHETTTFRHAFAKDTYKPDTNNGEFPWKIPERYNLSVLNAEADVHNDYLFPCDPEMSPIKSVDNDSENTSFYARKSGHFRVSSDSKQFQLWEENSEENSPSLDIFQNGDNNHLLEMDTADNISSVSQRDGSSQDELDMTQDSLMSSLHQRDDVSLCSASNSLPSSIARYHASKVGLFPSPSAGYPLPSDENVVLDKTVESNGFQNELQHDGSHDNHTWSLSANFGSSIQSSSSVNISRLLKENSLTPQVGCDGYHDINTPTGFVKLSKRPSPLSSFVNNLRQICSLDDTFLKIKRSKSEENEALISSSPRLTQQECSTNKRHSLNMSERVSVQQRLHEFGFLENNGRGKYVINPAPGKYEIGSREYNHVFIKNEIDSDRIRFLDRESTQCLNPDIPISNKDNYRQAKLALSEKCRSKTTIDQHIDRFTNIYQHEVDGEQVTDHMQRPPLQDKEGCYWEDESVVDVQTRRNVIEIHNETNPMFTEMCSDHNKSQAEEKTRIGTMIDYTKLQNRNHHGINLINHSGGNSTEISERRQAGANEHREVTFNTMSHVQMQSVAHDGITGFATKNGITYQENVTAKFAGNNLSDCSHLSSSAKEVDYTMTPLTSRSDSVLGKGNKLKRQSTNWKLMSHQEGDTSV